MDVPVGPVGTSKTNRSAQLIVLCFPFSTELGSGCPLHRELSTLADLPPLSPNSSTITLTRPISDSHFLFG